MFLKFSNTKKIVDHLSKGNIGIIPTDTQLGILTPALNKSSVEKTYKIKGRNPSKPFIILISTLKDLEFFNIKLTKKQIDFLSIWPNPISVVLDCPSPKLEYLHRGSYSLAFRLPNQNMLLKIISQTGPLIAPSANPEGFKPAKNTIEAFKYFGNNLDFYIEGSSLNTNPSTLIKLNKDGSFITLRQGDFLI